MTDTTQLPTDLQPIYVRFLRSGLTALGQVWRKGAVAVITGKPVLADETEADAAAVYRMFLRTEPEQRQRWPEGAYFEHLTREQYEAALGAPSVAPEAATVKPIAAVPPPEEGTTRGREGGQANPAPTSHVAAPAAELTPPPADLPPDAAPPAPAPDPEAAAWPWYADADVATTLGHVANMGDDEASRFLAYETSHQARSGVLGPMTGL